MLNFFDGPSGDFLPILKYDARAGKFFCKNRVQDAKGEWISEDTEIDKPVFLADVHHLEIGWIAFVDGIPDLRMIEYGPDADPGPAPSDVHKKGFRVLIQMSEKQGGDLRHFSHSAITVVNEWRTLFGQALQAPEYGQGLVPVIAVKGTKAIKSKQGSTNYAPQFSIAKWVERPGVFDAHLPKGLVPAGQDEVEDILFK